MSEQVQPLGRCSGTASCPGVAFGGVTQEVNQSSGVVDYPVVVFSRVRQRLNRVRGRAYTGDFVSVSQVVQRLNQVRGAASTANYGTGGVVQLLSRAAGLASSPIVRLASGGVAQPINKVSGKAHVSPTGEGGVVQPLGRCSGIATFAPVGYGGVMQRLNKQTGRTATAQELSTLEFTDYTLTDPSVDTASPTALSYSRGD